MVQQASQTDTRRYFDDTDQEQMSVAGSAEQQLRRIFVMKIAEMAYLGKGRKILEGNKAEIGALGPSIKH